MAGKNTAVFGIYRDRRGVEDAVDALRAAGFRNTDISVLFPENKIIHLTKGNGVGNMPAWSPLALTFLWFLQLARSQYPAQVPLYSCYQFARRYPL